MWLGTQYPLQTLSSEDEADAWVYVLAGSLGMWAFAEAGKLVVVCRPCCLLSKILGWRLVSVQLLEVNGLLASQTRWIDALVLHLRRE